MPDYKKQTHRLVVLIRVAEETDNKDEEDIYVAHKQQYNLWEFRTIEIEPDWQRTLRSTMLATQTQTTNKKPSCR